MHVVAFFTGEGSTAWLKLTIVAVDVLCRGREKSMVSPRHRDDSRIESMAIRLLDFIFSALTKLPLPLMLAENLYV